MSFFIAALPMYDWPEARAEVDAQWATIRERLRAAGIEAPETLTRRNADMPAVPGGIREAAGAIVAPDPATLPPDELDLQALWRHPALLFGQTCWGPMETTDLASHVRVVGQPDYSAYEGGGGEFYSSAVIVRASRKMADHDEPRSFTPPSVLPDISPTRGEIETASAVGDEPISPLVGEMSGRTEGGNVGRQRILHVLPPADGVPVLPLDLLRGSRLAYNEPHSMSGIIALTRDLDAVGESLDIFSARIETGAHRASVVAVAEGRADVCAIDCRTWHLVQKFKQMAADVQVVGWTAKRKGLPYIASRHLPDELAERVSTSIAALQAPGSLRSSG